MKLSLELLRATEDQVSTKGILHGDLRDGNFIIEDPQQEPKAKVIDFGLSRPLIKPSPTESKEEKQKPEGEAKEVYDVLKDPQLDIIGLGLLLSGIWEEFWLKKIPYATGQELWALIFEMKQGYVYIKIPSIFKSPDKFSVMELLVLMGKTHGFIAQEDKVYYVNSKMEVQLLPGLESPFKFGEGVLVDLEPSCVYELLRNQNFQPDEPIKKQNLELKDCIERMEKIVSQYCGSLPERHSITPKAPKAPSGKKELDFLMAEMGFFAPPKALEEAVSAKVSQSVRRNHSF